MRSFRYVFFVALFLACYASNALSAPAKAQVNETTVNTLERALKAYKESKFDVVKKELQPLIKKDEPISNYILGMLAARGDGEKQDLKKAEKLWLKAANKGVADAQYQLGRLYTSDAVGKPNISKARDLFAKAASNNHPPSLLTYGLMQISGEGGSKDPVKGVASIKKAADAGLPPAYMFLGKAYADGVGVKKDNKKAKEWFTKAKSAGIAQAQDEIAKLK